jgi:hypothetical protein
LSRVYFVPVFDLGVQRPDYLEIARDILFGNAGQIADDAVNRFVFPDRVNLNGFFGNSRFPESELCAVFLRGDGLKTKGHC